MRMKSKILFCTLVGLICVILLVVSSFDSPRLRLFEGLQIAYKISNGFKSGCDIDKQALQLQRRQLVEKTCNKFNITQKLDSNLFKNLIVDDERKILYCYVPKAACSNWKGTLVSTSSKYLQNPQPLFEIHMPGVLERYGLSQLNRYNAEEIQKKISTYFKFMFVRHPLTRLLSAYRDKFTVYNKWTAYFQKKYGRKMIEQFRPTPSSQSLDDGKDVKFEEFVAYLIDKSDSQGMDKFNPHWAPYYHLCQPCLVHYDFIGTVETLATDSECVFPKLHTNVSHFPKPGWIGPSSVKHDGGSNSRKVVEKFYSYIPSKHVNSLKEMYSTDCQMFGYDCSHVFGPSSLS